jgi:hypothetical protein
VYRDQSNAIEVVIVVARIVFGQSICAKKKKANMHKTSARFWRRALNRIERRRRNRRKLSFVQLLRVDHRRHARRSVGNANVYKRTAR